MRAFRFLPVVLTGLALILNVSMAAAASVGGRVRQNDTITPIVGATVSLYRVGETTAAYTTTSDGSGNYSFATVANGTYHARALSTTYGVSWYDDSVTRTTAAPIVVAASNLSINFIFNDTGKIIGVIDEPSGGSGGLSGAAGFIPGSPVLEALEPDFEGAFLRQRGETYGDYLADANARRLPDEPLILPDPASLILPEYVGVQRAADPAAWALSTMPLASQIEPMAVSMASVEARNIDTNVLYSTTADATGEYALKDLPPGRYKVNAYAPGYVREWYDDYYSESSALAVVLVGDGQTIDASFALERAGTVEGTVYDSNGTTPLSNRRVSWVSPNHTMVVRCTNGSGQYILPDVPSNAAFTLFVDGDRDCASNPFTYADEYWGDVQTSRNATPLSVGSSDTLSGMNFTLNIGGRISGTVYQPNGVTPIPSTSVYFYEANHTLAGTTTTNGSGVYTSPYFKPGMYYILLPIGGGYIQQYYVNALDFTGATQVNVSAGVTTPNINFTRTLLSSGGTGSLSGTVYLPGGVQPLANTTVNLWRWDTVIASISSTTTNASGQYSFTNLPAADYIVEVRPVDYPVEVYQNKQFQYEGTRVTVPNGGSITGINIILDEGVPISGTVYDSTTGLPFESPFVYAVGMPGGSQYVTGGDDGTYRVVVPEGIYTVYANDQPLGAYTYYGNVINIDDALTFNAVIGSPVTGINLTLGRLGEILGTVYEADGVTKVPNQGMAFLPVGSNFGLYFCSNALGDYRSVSAPIGVKTLVMANSGFCLDSVTNHAPEWWQESPTYDGADNVILSDLQRFQMDVDFTVDSPDATISGHVYGTDGVTPLEGITVQAYQYFKDGVSPYYSGDNTDASGAYQLEGLGTDSYVLYAQGLGYNTEYYHNSVSTFGADMVETVAGSDTPNIDFTIDLYGTTGTVDGTVTLQSRPPKPHSRWSIPMMVTITPQGGGAPIFDQMVMTDEYGMFFAPGVLPGNYRIRGKGMHTLANAVNVAVVLGDNSIDIGELKEGDANNSNTVTIADFSILAGTFSKSAGQVGFDPRADFNGDGAVTIGDFSLLAANFGQSGAAP